MGAVAAIAFFWSSVPNPAIIPRAARGIFGGGERKWDPLLGPSGLAARSDPPVVPSGPLGVLLMYRY